MIVRWEVLDRTFTTPDPVSIEHLAACHRAVCDNVAGSRDRLHAIASSAASAIWTGAAAQVFTESLGKLPSELDQALRSFATVADALFAYGGELRAVETKIRALAADATDAQTTEAVARAEHAHAVVSGHHAQAAYWEGRVVETEATLADLSGNLDSLLGQVDTLAVACVSRIRQAQGEGIKNSLFTFLERFVLLDLIEPLFMLNLRLDMFAGELIYDAFIKPIVALPGDVAELVEHPSFHTLGLALGDAGSIVGTAALAVAAIVPGADVAAIPALAEYLRATAAGVQGAATASDSFAAITHEPGATWGDAANAALSFGADRVGERLADGSVNGFITVGGGAPIAASGLSRIGADIFGGHAAVSAGQSTILPNRDETSWSLQRVRFTS